MDRTYLTESGAFRTVTLKNLHKFFISELNLCYISYKNIVLNII